MRRQVKNLFSEKFSLDELTPTLGSGVAPMTI